MMRSITNKLGLIALLALSSPIYAQDGLENFVSLNEYVNALKIQITAMEKGAAGTEDDVYISPIKVKLQAAVKKKIDGGIEFYVLTIDGVYEQTLTQTWEFDVSNKPTNGGFRASYGPPPTVVDWKILDELGFRPEIQPAELADLMGADYLSQTDLSDEDIEQFSKALEELGVSLVRRHKSIQVQTPGVGISVVR